MRSLPIVLIIALICQGCTSKPDTLIESYDQQEMDAAITRARNEVDRFIKELKNPTGEHHAVKVAIFDAEEEEEHFWLVNVTHDKGQFTGTINNEPGLVSNVSFGDRWQVAEAEISDWMFIRDGRIYGNYTIRPLFAAMSPAEAKQYRAMLAEP